MNAIDTIFTLQGPREQFLSNDPTRIASMGYRVPTSNPYSRRIDLTLMGTSPAERARCICCILFTIKWCFICSALSDCYVRVMSWCFRFYLFFLLLSWKFLLLLRLLLSDGAVLMGQLSRHFRPTWNLFSLLFSFHLFLHMSMPLSAEYCSHVRFHPRFLSVIDFFVLFLFGLIIVYVDVCIFSPFNFLSPPPPFLLTSYNYSWSFRPPIRSEIIRNLGSCSL